MGRDKAGLDLCGESLLERAVRRYRTEFGENHVFIASGDRSYGFAPAEIRDIAPGCGPISALHAALTGLEEQYAGVFLTAVDMPLAEPAFAARLIQFAEEAGRKITLCKNGESYETLFSWYGAELLPEIERCMQQGQYSLFRLAKKTGFAEFAAEQTETLLNTNTPEEFGELKRSYSKK
jgi:molybdopterin-guanine dinucleotide biosynthesis protein A